MNRDIKFRVWDTRFGGFIGNRWNNSFSFNLVDWACQHDHNNRHSWLDYNLEKDWSNYVVQQYTGLTDKNGKEIYEGDILKCKGYNNRFDTEGYCYNMEVKDIIVSSRESEASGFIYIPINREIIGNVFENSELLTK